MEGMFCHVTNQHSAACTIGVRVDGIGRALDHDTKAGLDRTAWLPSTLSVSLLTPHRGRLSQFTVCLKAEEIRRRRAIQHSRQHGRRSCSRRYRQAEQADEGRSLTGGKICRCGVVTLNRWLVRTAYLCDACVPTGSAYLATGQSFGCITADNARNLPTGGVCCLFGCWCPQARGIAPPKARSHPVRRH